MNAEQTVLINRPLEEVFAYLAHHQNASKWQADLVEASVDVGDVLRQGAKGHDARVHKDERQECGWVVTEYVPNSRIVYQSTPGQPRYTVQYSLKPLGGKTSFTCGVETELEGFQKVVAPLIKRTKTGRLRTDLATLKRILEEKS